MTDPAALIARARAVGWHPTKKLTDELADALAASEQARQAAEARDADARELLREYVAELLVKEAEGARLREALTRMLDPKWWSEEVDVNGEYTTTRARGYYEVVDEIRAALAAVAAPGEEGQR